MSGGATVSLVAGSFLQAGFLTGVACFACSSWPGLAPAGDLLSCCTARKEAKKRALHPASPTAPRSGAIGATCGHNKRRRAAELAPRQGAALRQRPQVRARSLAALRQPNRRRLLRPQALAERGGEGHPEQPTACENRAAWLLLALASVPNGLRDRLFRAFYCLNAHKKPRRSGEGRVRGLGALRGSFWPVGGPGGGVGRWG